MRFGQGHFSRHDLILQRLRHAVQQINRRAQLRHPVLHHSPLA